MSNDAGEAPGFPVEDPSSSISGLSVVIYPSSGLVTRVLISVVRSSLIDILPTNNIVSMSARWGTLDRKRRGAPSR